MPAPADQPLHQAGVIATLAYLFYRDAWSAVVIDIVFGCVGVITQLAFLDLAAKACPRHVEATFALLLRLQWHRLAERGRRLYDWYGYGPLVLISAGFTALAWHGPRAHRPHPAGAKRKLTSVNPPGAARAYSSVR
jgi:hypothetical protein